MNLRLLEIINIISVFQLSVFILFLVRKKQYRLSNILLALFLFVQIVIIINFEVFQFPDLVLNISPHLFHLGTAFILLAGPTFYLYVKSLTKQNYHLNRNDLLHAFPFILLTLFFCFSFYFRTADNKRLLLTSHAYLKPAFWFY